MIPGTSSKEKLKANKPTLPDNLIQGAFSKWQQSRSE
jgi:hypothetical protein